MINNSGRVVPTFYHTFRFVKHRDADAYLKLGWSPTEAFVGTYYEQFSVLFVWMCDCPAPEPVGRHP